MWPFSCGAHRSYWLVSSVSFTSFCDACEIDLEDVVSPEKKNKSKARTGYTDTGYRTCFRLLQGSL